MEGFTDEDDRKEWESELVQPFAWQTRSGAEKAAAAEEMMLFEKTAAKH